MLHQELVCGHEFLTATCDVVCILNVSHRGGATASGTGIGDWNREQREDRPLATVHSRCFVMADAGSDPCDSQHKVRSFSFVWLNRTTRFRISLRDVI